MNKKLLTIQVLKQRMVNMQKQLTNLEKQRQQPKRSISKSKEHSQNSIRNTSSNKRYKSPTFWTGNPLLGQQNPYFSQKRISPMRKPQRNMSFTSKSPILQKIKKDINLSFYQSTPQEKQNQPNYQSVKQMKKGNFCKTNQKKIFELLSDTPKIQKKKTYELPKKDPILNPEPPKISSKKITHPQSRSPQNMFVQNPNSNPNLYFSSTQPVTLSPKVNNKRNKSPGLKLILSNSLERLENFNQTPKSSKKHFNKYFQENFESKWTVQW